MNQPPNTPDPFEFLKSLWGPFGVPVPGVMTPTMDVGELDKRITDLKSVENWLNMNLGVLRMTIQGLEMQKATLAAVQGGIAESARAMQGAMQPPGAVPPPQDAWFDMLRQAQEAAEKARNSDTSGKK